MVVANIDADAILFRGCFACEKSVYTLTFDWEGARAVPCASIEFENRRSLDAYLKQEKLTEGYEIIKTSNLKPLEYALGTIKNMLLSIGEKLDADEFNLYLTGKDNFRYSVAKTYPYKGNREKTHRPHWSQEAIEYLCKHWGARIMDGMEADDALGIAQTDTSILVSPDKDLDQIPGWHYNPVKDIKYHIGDFEATYKLHHQMLTGDNTDNIKGIPGIGPVRATSILAGLTSKAGLAARVQDMYREAFGEKAEDRYEENLALLRILRSEKELENVL